MIIELILKVQIILGYLHKRTLCKFNCCQFYPHVHLKEKNKLVCEQICVVHTDDFYLYICSAIK